KGDASSQVDANANGALVQVRLALALARRQAQHGQHRIALEHNHANIRHAFKTDGGKHRVWLHPVLDQRTIAMTAERINPGQDAGDMELDIVERQKTAAAGAIQTLEPVLDHQYAVTTSPLCRLDDEVI